MAVWWDCISRRGRGRGGEGSTDEQPLSDQVLLIRCGETYSIGSNNLNLSFSGAQEKVLCEKDNRKMCYILSY